MLRFKKGFSLLELLIVMAIIIIISSIGVDLYRNYGKNVEVSSAAETIMFDLKQAQSRAMIGEGGFKWGIHFVNGTTDYYEIFSTPTDYSSGSKVIASTNYLSTGVTFSDPAASSSKDIIFNKVSGGTTASSVTIDSSTVTKTISVLSIGTISVQ
jgi:prepilin-type N-terminal cleavage/methylation domain-containing protein